MLDGMLQHTLLGDFIVRLGYEALTPLGPLVRFVDLNCIHIALL
jgi:hypothetical protein